MKLISFDQFEFESWEGEECLVFASELKAIRGSMHKSIKDFFNSSKSYDQFVY